MNIVYSYDCDSSHLFLNVVLAVIFYNLVLHCSREPIVLFLALCFVIDTTLHIGIECFFIWIAAQLQLSHHCHKYYLHSNIDYQFKYPTCKNIIDFIRSINL